MTVLLRRPGLRPGGFAAPLRPDGAPVSLSEGPKARSRRRSAALPALGALLLVLSAPLAFAYAPTQAGTQPLEPQLEARVQALGKQIRCAVCQGMSIADSPASMARAQLDTVRTMVKDGRSDEEIKAFFVERYGEFALLKPNTEGINALVWIGPVAVFLAGLGLVLYYVARHKPGAAQPSPQEPAAPSTPDPAPAAGSDDPYVKALRSELEQ